MRILKTTYAVFWSRKGWQVQFHADMPEFDGDTPSKVVRRFKKLFPNDVVRSVRNSKGRFVAFTNC